MKHPERRRDREAFGAVCLCEERREVADGRRTDEKLVGDAVDGRSAGTKPGSSINELSAESLLEVGVDITAEVPGAITEDMIRAADVVGTPPLNHWPRSPQLRSRPG